ncbi:MAG: TolC family protein [Verrucomicrobia bacterium]|nr:TolC family protein [Verrucomicrobiota bacterium]
MKSLRAVPLCLLLAVVARGADAPPPPATAAPEFHTVTLADCYAQTLARNPDIGKARLEIERAAGMKLVFTSRALPRLGMQATAGGVGGSLYGSGGPFALARASVGQPLFDAGIPATLRRGKVEAAIAQQTLNRTVTEQLHATRLAYLRALLCRRLLEVQRQIESHLQANLRSAQQRLDVGKVGRQAVQQAEIQLLNLKPQISKTQRAYLNAATELAVRTGQRLEANGRLQLPEPAGNLEYARLQLDLEQEAARTVGRRPDLALLREMIRAAEEERRMVKAGYFPFVSLAALSQYVPKDEVFLNRPEITPGQEARSTETRYGVTFTWQVIDTGRVTGVKRQIESVQRALEVTLRRLEENVPRELAVLTHELDTVEAKFAGLKQSAGEAEELLKLVETRVEQGAATQLDFLNAQSNQLSTQAGILQAVFENEVARAEFDRITGRYLEFIEQPAK